MKTIKYEDWLKKADDARKVSSKILSSFDISVKRKQETLTKRSGFLSGVWDLSLRKRDSGDIVIGRKQAA